MASERVNELIDRIQAALEANGPHFWTTSQKGEKWLQATCPFHEDRTPSFRFQPATHVFYCHACAKPYTPLEVAHALHVQLPPGRPMIVPKPPVIEFQGKQVEAVPLPYIRYEYHFPDGRLSHYVNRIEHNGKKEFPVCGPDLTDGLPKEYYPIYQPATIPPDAYILVVEGEKCVEAVESAKDKIDAPIHAVTWMGGGGQAKKHALLLAAHVQKLAPKRIVLWPDDDEPGYKAMAAIGTTLRQLNLRYSVIAPSAIGLTLKQDVFDYLLAGKSLADAIQQFQQEGTPDVAALAEKTLVTSEELLIEERTLYPFDNSNFDMIWQHAYGALPKRDQLRELHTALKDKARHSPTRVIYRTVADADSFYWRTLPGGRCLRISKDGVQMADDPSGWVIVVHREPDSYPNGYAPGTKADFDTWLDQFRLGDLSKQLIEAWLCCTFMNLQTPVLLLRGPAGTGKTTLARSILAVVEPGVPELPLTESRNRDERGLIRTLELTKALLLDNVSSLPKGTEDLLSKLVTGANIQIRSLYKENVESLTLRRSIVMTTIGYDIYQSDLSDRTIAMTPALKTDYQYESASQMKQAMDAVLDKVRGYIFGQCSSFYARRHTVADNHFRVGDLGWVLAALGYDTAQIASDMRASRREIVVQHDPMLEAIVDLFRATGMDEWIVPTETLAREMSGRMREDIKTVTLGRYVQEKEAQFRDYGFTVETKRGTGGIRRWRFSKID